MAIASIGPERQAGGNAFADVPPMIGHRIGSVDAGGFDSVDRLDHRLDLGPTIDPRQNVGAGTTEWERGKGVAGGPQPL